MLPWLEENQRSLEVAVISGCYPPYVGGGNKSVATGREARALVSLLLQNNSNCDTGYTIYLMNT